VKPTIEALNKDQNYTPHLVTIYGFKDLGDGTFWGKAYFWGGPIAKVPRKPFEKSTGIPT
jgi:hypothetical protein